MDIGTRVRVTEAITQNNFANEDEAINTEDTVNA